jgi:two-component system LytT family sensor kinase
MKKGILALLLLHVVAINFIPVSFGQSTATKAGNTFYFDFVTTDLRMMVKQRETFGATDTAISHVLEYEAGHYANDPDAKPRSSIMLGVKLNPNLEDFFSNPVKSISKEYSNYIIKDSSAAILVAMGINENNIKDYRYHVVENDSIEIVPWSKIPQLQQKYGATQPYGYLGKFQSPGKQILVEVQNIRDYIIRDGVIFDWRVNFKPIITQITIATPDDGKSINYFNLNYSKMNKGYASRFDDKTGLPLDFKFPVDSVTNIRFDYKEHTTIPYVIYLIKNFSGKIDTTEIGYYNLENYYDLDGKYYNQPGKYEIIIQRANEMGHWPESQVQRIQFEVLPPPPNKKAAVTLKQTLPYIIATLTGVVLLFGGYYRRNQVKLLRAAQEKQTAGLKLQSIRAQLNPHFMFNALTSIQNLVNKNDIAGANHYLSKFAGLTRQVLDTGNEELLNLEQEINILDNYLQMEQLRFGFKYKIDVDKTLNLANTEIPAMLLQPFAENAVKHGVAVLKENGKIDIAITRQEKDLLFCITDNGKWIDKSNDEIISGYGLKLSEERVALLNKLYKEQPLTLTITKQPVTLVCIRLSNWI